MEDLAGGNVRMHDVTNLLNFSKTSDHLNFLSSKLYPRTSKPSAKPQNTERKSMFTRDPRAGASLKFIFVTKRNGNIIIEPPCNGKISNRRKMHLEIQQRVISHSNINPIEKNTARGRNRSPGKCQPAGTWHVIVWIKCSPHFHASKLKEEPVGWSKSRATRRLKNVATAEKIKFVNTN